MHAHTHAHTCPPPTHTQHVPPPPPHTHTHTHTHHSPLYEMVQEGIDIKSIQWTQHWQLNNAHTQYICTINHPIQACQLCYQYSIYVCGCGSGACSICAAQLLTYHWFVIRLFSPLFNSQVKFVFRSPNWWTPLSYSIVRACYVIVLVQWAYRYMSKVNLYLNMYEDVIFVAYASHVTA